VDFQVAEVFLTAGHAFQKLGDLAMRLQAPISEHSDETNWSNAEVEMLKESLTRFAHDLENISAMVQARTMFVGNAWARASPAAKNPDPGQP
jgi:hypothetical protein